jgi:hypothetical protein
MSHASKRNREILGLTGGVTIMLSALNTWLDKLPPSGIYLIILVLTAIVYKTAFARPLPLLKNVLVYLVMAAGCLLLTMFHYMRFPMIPVLALTVIMIAVTRLRLWIGRKQEK